MPISKDLLLAILSMDSYNHSYGEGITGLGGLGSKIGESTLSTDSETVTSTKDTAQAAGFYAASYDTPYGKVISYRGTDNFSKDPDAGGNDILKGWVGGVGVITPQSTLALEFYQAVTGLTVADGPAANTILTGRSLGGGLAFNLM